MAAERRPLSVGLFGRDKNDKVLNDWSGSVESAGINFANYDLSGLGDDVRSIVDLPDAMIKTAKWAFGLPIAVGILSWIIFSGRMAGWVLVPFVLGAMVLSTLTAVFVGGFFVARTRLDTVSTATNRVVSVIGEMHADVVQVKQGHSSTSVQQVATGLLEHAIFPVVFGVVEGMAPGSASGPLGAIRSKVTGAPMQLVQKSVIAAVAKLPDKEIGTVVDDLAGAMPEISSTLTELNANYQRVAGEVDGVVARVSKATLGSVITAAVLATIPLLLWLILGWVAS